MRKILLIEDSDEVRGLLQEALEAAGYDVLAVPEGGAGILAQFQFGADVIVTDLFMPGMEGLETIIELRQRYPYVRIIAISGGSHRFYGERADHHLASAREVGADAVLRKPFHPEQLIGALRELVD